MLLEPGASEPKARGLPCKYIETIQSKLALGVNCADTVPDTSPAAFTVSILAQVMLRSGSLKPTAKLHPSISTKLPCTRPAGKLPPGDRPALASAPGAPYAKKRLKLPIDPGAI